MHDTSIYIHVPWCRRRCPYCDFYLVVGKPDQGFVDHIKAEWHEREKNWHQGQAKTLYFGGGTPSLLAPLNIASLVGFFHERGLLALDAEVTIEVNPEDVTKEFALGIMDAGINRISLGIQSFDDQVLRFLGRKHRGADARRALLDLVHAGFSNISLDLIIGLHENPLTLIETIKEIHGYGIPHISAYLLTIEESTNFHKRVKKGQLRVPSDDAQADCYSLVQETLLGLGFQQYDISSYAQAGFMSRHNQVYWGDGSYIGLGPGAHSMRFLPDGGIERAHNQTLLADWLKNPAGEARFSRERLGPHEALLESLAFGLRNMVRGIKPEHLAMRHGVALPLRFVEVVEKYKNCGWLIDDASGIRLTSSGALFADAIMRDILSLSPADEREPGRKNTTDKSDEDGGKT